MKDAVLAEKKGFGIEANYRTQQVRTLDRYDDARIPNLQFGDCIPSLSNLSLHFLPWKTLGHLFFRLASSPMMTMKSLIEAILAAAAALHK